MLTSLLTSSLTSLLTSLLASLLVSSLTSVLPPQTLAFEGHSGPLTGVHVHPYYRDVGDGGEASMKWSEISTRWGEMLLTCSTDWTVTLWTHKSTSAQQMVHRIKVMEDADDYVYDVQWSPLHPALFAAVDGTGTIALWNLAEDMEVPANTLKVSEHALNKLRWFPHRDAPGSSGSAHKIATGDCSGAVVVLDVDARIAMPMAEVWGKFTKAIAEKVHELELE